mmetsp:Transcript_39596/g.105288  ORF Transcript_39596/g.105288 Transcript_39596/m.105288 type:complete len:87 (+) Transcript_39596:230-490(+)
MDASAARRAGLVDGSDPTGPMEPQLELSSLGDVRCEEQGRRGGAAGVAVLILEPRGGGRALRVVVEATIGPVLSRRIREASGLLLV